MLKSLIKIANKLDDKGFVKEADIIDGIINKIASKKEQDNAQISDSEKDLSLKNNS